MRTIHTERNMPMKTYSTADASLRLGIAHSTIRRWCCHYAIGKIETQINGRPISGVGQRRLTERDLKTLLELDVALRAAKIGRPTERGQL